MNKPTEFNKRMSDQYQIPELNGTIKRLTEMLSEPLETPEQQEKITKELIRLQLNSWLIQKQIYEALNSLLAERKSIIDRVIDKFLSPFLYTVFIIILWLVFQNFKP